MGEEKVLVQDLEFVDSIHEQREFCKMIIPKKGCWVEIGNFTPVIESFDIKERWKCKTMIEDEKTIIVELIKLDHVKQRNDARKIIEKIIEKHGVVLKQSFLMALARGIHNKKATIERFHARIKFRKDKKGFDLWERQKALKRDIEKRKDDIKAYEEELIKLQKEAGEHGREIISGSDGVRVEESGLQCERDKNNNDKIQRGQNAGSNGEKDAGRRQEEGSRKGEEGKA